MSKSSVNMRLDDEDVQYLKDLKGTKVYGVRCNSQTAVIRAFIAEHKRSLKKL